MKKNVKKEMEEERRALQKLATRSMLRSTADENRADNSASRCQKATTQTHCVTR